MEMRLLAILLVFLAFSVPLFAAVGWSVDATSAVNGPAAMLLNKAIFSTNDGKTYALDADTGAVMWVHEAGAQVAFGAQILDANNVAIVTSMGKLLILGADKGNVVCELSLNGIPTGFAAGKGKAYVALNDSVRAFDSSCAPAWSAPLHSSAGQIGMDISNIYLTSGGKLYSIASATGAINWAASAGDSFLSTPVEYGGVVYLGSTDKRLYAVDRNSGYVKWSYKTGGWVMGTPKPTSDAVYFSSNDGYFYALGRNGNLLFKTSLPEGAWVQPEAYSAGSGVAVVFGANDGNVHAINGADGKEIWTFSSYGKPGQTVRYKQSFIFGTGAGKIYSLSSSPVCGFVWPRQMESVGDWPVEIEGRASADGGVSSVEIRVAGGQWQAAEGKGEWRAVADIRNVPLGMVTIECRATDASGKTEQGDYSSITLVKSENALLQKMSIAAPGEVDIGGNFTISAKDSRGKEIRNVKVTIGSETKTSDSPIYVALSKEGLNDVLVEKPGFESSEFGIRAKGKGNPLLLLAAGAVALAGAWLLFKRRKKK